MNDLTRIALYFSLLLLPSALFAASLEAKRAADSAIHSRLLQLETQAESAADRQWLQSLLNYEETVTQPHPDRHTAKIPRFYIAARAASLLQSWDDQNRLLKLQAIPNAAMGKSPLSDADIRVRKAWIAQAQDEELARYRANIDMASLPESLMISLIQRQARFEDYLQLAQRGRSAQAIVTLRQSLQKQTFNEAQNQQLLNTLQDNPALRSAGTALYTAWLQQHPTHQYQFFENFHDNAWGIENVRIAIALNPAQSFNIFRQRLAEPQQAALAAWALWKLATPQALAELRRFSQSADAAPHLAQEIQAWLP